MIGDEANKGILPNTLSWLLGFKNEIANEWSENLNQIY